MTIFHLRVSLLPALLCSLLALVFVGCNNEDPDEMDEPEVQVSETLDCNFFATGEDIVLEDKGLAVDYIIDCPATLLSSRLTIEPGVTIEFTAESGLRILDAGALVAQGTAEDPIVLTAVDKIAGAWKGVYIESANVVNRLDYVTISYGGGAAFNSNDNKGNLIIAPLGGISVDHCTLSHSATYGFNIVSEADIPVFTNNTLTDNDKPAIAYASEMHHFDATTTFAGNTNDYVEILCSFYETGDYTIRKLDVPYRILAANFGLTRALKVPDNTNLTIEPGVRMVFTDDTGIETDRGSSFRAVGTPSEPIVFTAVNELAGAWRGIEVSFSQSVNNLIDHAEIRYAGAGENGSAIYMWAEPRLTVSNTLIADIDGCAFRTPADPFDNPNFTDTNVTTERLSGGVKCP
mgnify:CR=1 FL=1